MLLSLTVTVCLWSATWFFFFFCTHFFSSSCLPVLTMSIEILSLLIQAMASLPACQLGELWQSLLEGSPLLLLRVLPLLPVSMDGEGWLQGISLFPVKILMLKTKSQGLSTLAIRCVIEMWTKRLFLPWAMRNVGSSLFTVSLFWLRTENQTDFTV